MLALRSLLWPCIVCYNVVPSSFQFLFSTSQLAPATGRRDCPAHPVSPDVVVGTYTMPTFPNVGASDNTVSRFIITVPLVIPLGPRAVVHAPSWALAPPPLCQIPSLELVTVQSSRTLMQQPRPHPSLYPTWWSNISPGEDG